MVEGSDCVRGREPGQRTTSVRVKEAGRPGHAGKPGVHYPLNDLGKGLEQNYDTEGCGRVISGPAGLIKHNAIGLLKSHGVGAVRHQRG